MWVVLQKQDRKTLVKSKQRKKSSSLVKADFWKIYFGSGFLDSLCLLLISSLAISQATIPQVPWANKLLSPENAPLVPASTIVGGTGSLV